MLTEKVEAKYSNRAKRWKLIFFALVALLIVLIVLCLNIGYAPINFSEILSILGKQIPYVNSTVDTSTISPANEAIITLIRLPRILAGALVGAGLAAAGVMYQGVFRNPMADSYLLGASAGASFAYTLAVIYSGSLGATFVGMGLFQAAAFAGSVLTVFLVYFMSRVGRKVPITTLLLSGIVVNIFILSLQTLFELRSGQALNGIVAWIAGGFTNITWNNIFVVFPIVLGGTLVAYFFTKDLNMLSMGDDTAQHLGVNTEKVRQILLLIGCLITAAAVSISGVIPI
jgi:iron complex transport system permease protein